MGVQGAGAQPGGHDAEPSPRVTPPARGPADRGARGSGRRPGRRSGRAPEPPDSGPAAVDPEPDPESVARAIALRLLTGAPRSRAQLADAMARRDVPDDVAARVLDRFTEVGLVDDAEYARVLVRSRHADRGLARRALGVELRRRGIDDELAAQALGTVDAEQEEATARELARRRLAATTGLAPEVRTRRVVAMLGRKGYSGGLAHRLVRELIAAEDGEDRGPEHPWPSDADDGAWTGLTDDP